MALFSLRLQPQLTSRRRASSAVLIKVVLFAIFTYRSDPVPWLLNCKSFGVSGVTTRDRLFS